MEKTPQPKDLPAPNDALVDMRDRIKSLALDLLIQHGYRGMSFGDLAEVLQTTRANIHYHFGNKETLVEEVLEDYVDITSAQLHAIWTKFDASFFDKIQSTVEYSRKRHSRYNDPGSPARPWSLIARMRQDSDALTPKGRALLQRFGKDLHASIAAAIENAKAKHELDGATPTEDVALQLVSIANSAGPITQDAGTFDRLEHLYMAFARIVTVAFGSKKYGAAKSALRGNAKQRTAKRERAPVRQRGRKTI
jgi:TetR/AcrR family transcriptional repressor of nem operon